MSTQDTRLLDEYLTKDEAADELDINVRTLNRWWAERRGPPRTKIGARVYYRRSAVRDWLAAQETMPTRGGAAV